MRDPWVGGSPMTMEQIAARACLFRTPEMTGHFFSAPYLPSGPNVLWVELDRDAFFAKASKRTGARRTGRPRSKTIG
ncbi:hypothetical protein CspHIS471_0609810 [Cutaneotrichosporon sp. HIS471]|nr:hypothetical protein CspHIS471_0609810 [Cutaneotrichosporon sp. HIS471]